MDRTRRYGDTRERTAREREDRQVRDAAHVVAKRALEGKRTRPSDLHEMIVRSMNSGYRSTSRDAIETRMRQATESAEHLLSRVRDESPSLSRHIDL